MERPIVQTDSPDSAAEPILQFLEYMHLPPPLAAVSRPFCELAHAIVFGEHDAEAGAVVLGPLPPNPERGVALRKLLEAKDAAVRAVLFK